MKKYVLPVAIAVPAISLIAAIWLFIHYQAQLDRPMAVDNREIFLITEGASLKMIGRELVHRGWVEQPYYFVLEGRRRGLANSIKTGEYGVVPGMSARQFLELIVSGKVIQYSLTIPEGWTFTQIIKAVTENNHLERTLFVTSADEIMARLGFSGQHPEGMFFPDTYLFPSGTTDVQFLKRAYRMMVDVLEEEWQQRDLGLPYQEPYQALIMASIIEKETAVADERYRIAGVFKRRLERGIKLQTDPTVIYAAGERFNGDITNRDLTLDSPYNTYLYPGLPPTPIAAPGRDSIRAALHPAEGTELYFVATGDGRHYFSNTLAEHNQAVEKYQLKK